MNARTAAGLSGLILLVAAVASWFVPPSVTAILVALAVVVMSAWQIHRRRASIAPTPPSTMTTFVIPLTFGALAVVALNGWIYRISAEAGDSGELQTIGLVTGVIGMAAAYGYGRLRAQKAQLDEVVEVNPADDTPETDDDQWFFPQAK